MACLDAAAHDAQRVDVEAGVELVEDGDLGPQHAELQRLVALLLAARQVDVERPVEEAGVEADALGLGDDAHAANVGEVAAGGLEGLARAASSSDTPGTSVGYCMARNRPACARCHGGSASRSTPSRVTDPAVTS